MDSRLLSEVTQSQMRILLLMHVCRDASVAVEQRPERRAREGNVW